MTSRQFTKKLREQHRPQSQSAEGSKLYYSRRPYEDKDGYIYDGKGIKSPDGHYVATWD